MNTILFDLDGTLLPIDLETFTGVYLKEISKVCAPKLNCDGNDMIRALWTGTKEMQKNDGAMSNHDRFWLCFEKLIKADLKEAEKITDEFYSNEFAVVKPHLRKTDLPAQWIKTLKDKGYALVLATNPLFPTAAIRARLDWLGLSMDDFILATDYANSSFCKPNPDYYTEILGKIGKAPAECMMVGNNVHEDMCATKLGMGGFLITDFLENPQEVDFAAAGEYSSGDYDAFTAFVDGLPEVK